MAYDFDNNEMKSCTLTNDIVFSANMNSGFSDGTAYFKQVFQQECAAASEDEGGGATTGSGGATTGDGGQGGNNNNTDNIPATDQLMKLGLERCTDHNC